MPRYEIFWAQATTPHHFIEIHWQIRHFYDSFHMFYFRVCCVVVMVSFLCFTNEGHPSLLRGHRLVYMRARRFMEFNEAEDYADGRVDIGPETVPCRTGTIEEFNQVYPPTSHLVSSSSFPSLPIPFGILCLWKETAKVTTVGKSYKASSIRSAYATPPNFVWKRKARSSLPLRNYNPYSSVSGPATPWGFATTLVTHERNSFY